MNQPTNAPMQPTLLMASLVIGALLGIALVLPLDPVISMPEELGSWPINPTAEYMAKYNQAYSKMWMGNLAINFALIGVATGAVPALMFARRASAGSRVAMVLLSLLGGGLAGLVTGLMLASAHSTQGRFNLLGWNLDPMFQSVLFHTICWSSIGIGIGAAIAMGRRQPVSKGIMGGLMGGFIAAMLHALIGSIVFPSSDMANLLPPNAIEKFLWVAYSAAALGGGIWWMLRERSLAAEALPGLSDN